MPFWAGPDKQGRSSNETTSPEADLFRANASPGKRGRKGAMTSEKAARSRKQIRPRI